jgi:hypothetical protein
MLPNEDLQQQLLGVQGETLFHRPVVDVFASIEDQLKADGLRSTLNRMQNYEDERSMVLLAALASEAVIDKLLAAIIPGYVAELRDQRDMPFSLKIKLLKALAIVPKHLTGAADLVRGVRNKFAHQLTVEKLDDLRIREAGRKKSKDESIVTRMQQYYARHHILPADRRDDLAHVFDAIALIATAGLAAYIHMVRDLHAEIREPAFEQKLYKRAEQRQKTQAKQVLAHLSAPPPPASGGQPI